MKVFRLERDGDRYQFFLQRNEDNARRLPASRAEPASIRPRNHHWWGSPARHSSSTSSRHFRKTRTGRVAIMTRVGLAR
jgi:hypothetical protein